MNILTVVGARPQFVKAAPVSRALVRAGIKEILVHTGQHYDDAMSAVFFKELKLPPPTINLNTGSGSHAIQTASILQGLDRYLDELAFLPDYVLVYGDTNSTLAAALTAAKRHIPVVHIEAGLRSFNRAMPEEINRILTDQIASVLFCPNETAVQHLNRENIYNNVFCVGDVMEDSMHFALSKLTDEATRLELLQLIPATYTLATIHRAENTNFPARLRDIFAGFEASGANIVLPLHPRTRLVLEKNEIKLPVNVRILPPLGYLDMLTAMKNARKIVTDSGGVQKEAYWLGIPCITLRNETEWTETLEQDRNVLVGSNAVNIAHQINATTALQPRSQPYSTDVVANNIVQMLKNIPI